MKYFLNILILVCGPLCFSVAVAADAKPLDVTLRMKQQVNIRMTSNVAVVRFENVSDDPVKIIKPLDGSMWSWHMPFYRFQVWDRQGQPLGLQERLPMSGLWYDTDFPEDYEIVLSPGGTHQFEQILPVVIPSNGIYRMRFEYIFDPELSYRDFWTYPEDTWVGRVSSAVISTRMVETK